MNAASFPSTTHPLHEHLLHSFTFICFVTYLNLFLTSINIQITTISFIIVHQNLVLSLTHCNIELSLSLFLYAGWNVCADPAR